MVKSFRFLLNFAWANLGAIIAFAVIVIAGCYATGVPDNASARNVFVTYYAMFPTMVLLCLFLYAFALCTNNLNLGLSMGGRRGDFFWALQGIMVFYTAVCWALQWFISALPAIANWTSQERWNLLMNWGGGPWTYPLICMALLVLGCLSGLLMVKSKILGTIVVILSVFALMGATIFLILSTETGIIDFLPRTPWQRLLTALPKVLGGTLAVFFAGGEFLIWRTIQRYVVR